MEIVAFLFASEDGDDDMTSNVGTFLVFVSPQSAVKILQLDNRLKGIPYATVSYDWLGNDDEGPEL